MTMTPNENFKQLVNMRITEEKEWTQTLSQFTDLSLADTNRITYRNDIIHDRKYYVLTTTYQFNIIFYPLI